MENKEYPVKLLVTGASGLLGSKLTELATKKNFQVYSAYYQNTPQQGTPIQFDISKKTSTEKAFNEIKPDIVVHAAALTHVDRCEIKKELAWKINVQGTENIAKSCRRYRTYLVYVSTDYVFNGEKGNYRETDLPAPINHYGTTKLKGEEHVQSLAPDACIARTSVVYGSIPATGKTNFALWLLDKLRRNEEVKIVTDQTNSPTLNTNLANMILKIVERRLTGIYHLAGATALSRYDFAKALAEEFNLNTQLVKPATSKEIAWVAKRPRNSSLNVAKATQTLGSKPLKIHEALRELREELSLNK